MSGLAPRWIIVGDSIHAGVYSDTGMGNPAKLTASVLPQRVGISVNNVSSPGQRVSEGGQPGFGAYANRAGLIGSVKGYSDAAGVIIDLGTNDWANPGSSIYDYMNQLRALIQYCRTTLWLPVVLIGPHWRADGDTPIYHVDGSSWTLAQWAYFTENVGYEEAVKPGPFLTVIRGSEVPSSVELLVADGIHYNEAGQEARTDFLISRMQSVGYWCTQSS